MQTLNNYTKVAKYTECICCKQSFNNANVHTALGWKETQISGMCENCFDAMFDNCVEGLFDE